MKDLDDLFEEQYSIIESGAGAGFEGQDPEISALVRLATAIRNVEGPQMDSARVRLGRQKAMDAALAADQRRPQPARQRSIPVAGWLAVGLIPAGIVLLFLVSITLFLTAGGLYWNAERLARQAIVENVSGEVMVSTNGSAGWDAVDGSAKIHTGWQVRTGEGSEATLVFHEGSSLLIGPDTELTLDQIGGGWGDTLEVEISQSSGKTVNHVIPLRGADSYYLIHTPAGTTSVHGTTFSVEVEPSGDSHVLVDSGTVTVAGAGEQVVLLAGQATSARPGRAPDAPAYQFSGQGTLSAINGTTWTVDGVSFTVIDETVVSGDPSPGDFVSVRGRILDGGLWLADEIKRLDEVGISSFRFTGRVESILDRAWIVSGVKVSIDDRTKIEEGLEVGDLVKVTFSTGPDDSWLAQAITGLEQGDDEPTPTPRPSALPDLLFRPDELRQNGCGDRFKFSGTLVNTNPDDEATDVELGFVLGQNAGYVKSVTLLPSSWESIPSGGEVTFDVQVSMSDAWAGAPDGTMVRLQIIVVSPAGRNDEIGPRLSLAIVADCRGTPTPTRTPTPTSTWTPTPEVSVTPPGDTNCTGANPHPHGLTLAQRYGVPYEEIMGWFCQGFGFGEIEHAYTLSQETGVSVNEIFNLRKSGLGWGQITKQLDGGKKPGKK